MLSFTWDPRKNMQNQRKHGITFEEARTVFFDENALIFNDPDHSDYEERFLLLGYSAIGNILVVVHCYRHSENEIRIISARKATKKERLNYMHESRW